MRTGMFPQPEQIFAGFLIILFTADQILYFRIKGLHANFKLQRIGRKLFQHLFQAIRQVIGHHFKMQIQIIGHTLQKEFKNGDTGADFQIKCAINKFEIARATLMKQIDLLQKFFKRKRFRSHIQRRQTKFAFEWTAA